MAALKIENPGVYFPPYGPLSEKTVPGGADTVDKLFLLSSGEVTNFAYGFANDSTRVSGYNNKFWWLRSPGNSNLLAGVVLANGEYWKEGYLVRQGSDGTNYTMYSRPAFNLNLSSVLFSSAENETKSDFKVIDSDKVSSKWKLTLKDESGTFLYDRIDNEPLSPGSEIKIDVTEISSQYEYITAMVLDNDNTVLGYGKIDDASTGIKTFTIPNDVTGGTQIKFFAETWNTGNKTDYAREYGRPPEPTQTDNNVETKKSEDTFVNPLSWYYEANPYGSLCLMSKQGPVCTTLFQLATPKGFKEAFSFNLLLKENGVFQPTYDKKAGKFVLNIPKEYQKAGRTFMLIGIDKFGNTKVFTDNDLSDETFTTMLDMDGYAFSLIYTDEPITKK